MKKHLYRKWLVFSLLLCGTLLVAARTQIQAFYFLFWLLLSYSFISLLYLTLVYFFSSLRPCRFCHESVLEEDILKIRCVLENKSWFFLFNTILEDFLPCAGEREQEKKILFEFISAKSSVSVEYSCHCPRRGIFDLEGFKIYFFDPLGLFYLQRKYPCKNTVTVIIKTFRVRFFPALKKGILPWFGIESNRISGEDDEFFGIRQYQQGEFVKKVHWISTARHRQLILTQFQRISFSQTTLLFSLEKEKNFGEGKESVAEYIIRIAASLSSYLLGKNIAVELIAHDGQFIHIPPARGVQQEKRLFTFFSQTKADSKTTIRELLEDSLHYIRPLSNLVIFMLDRDWEDVLNSLRLEKRDVSFIPVVLIASSFQYGIKENKILDQIKMSLSYKLNFRPIMISREDDLETVFYNPNYGAEF